MLKTIESLSEDSRVFIYPGSRKFYPKEIPVIREKLGEFCECFEGVEMSYDIKYDRFLVFMVADQTPLDLDQQNLLVDFIQGLEKEFSVVLLDKVNVCFKQGEYVQLKEVTDFKKLIKNKGVSKNTIVFDLLINTKEEYEQFFEVPAKESWVSHFF